MPSFPWAFIPNVKQCMLFDKDFWSIHGRRSLGWGGGQVPQNLEWGCWCKMSPSFCHIGTKRSVLWPSKYAKIRFRPWLCSGPRWESSRRFSRPFSRLGRGHPSPHLTPLDTDPPSALAMRPPEFQPDLRLRTYCRYYLMTIAHLSRTCGVHQTPVLIEDAFVRLSILTFPAINSTYSDKFDWPREQCTCTSSKPSIWPLFMKNVRQ